MKQIILLHGAAGASDQLWPLAQKLELKGYTVFNFSFSGHGNMPFKEGFGIRQFASELYTFVLEHNLHRPHVFGYSMGGFVALQLASEKPDILGNIMTLGSKFNWTEEVALREANMLQPEKLKEKVPHFAAALQERHGAEHWELLLSRTRDMMHDLAKEHLLSANVCSGITNRVLLGVGDADNMVSLEETRAMQLKLANAGLFVLPFTKHPIELVRVDSLLFFMDSFFVDEK